MSRRLIAGTINRYWPEPGWENVHLDASARPLNDGRPAELVLRFEELADAAAIARSATGPLLTELLVDFDEVRCWQALEHLPAKTAHEALRGFYAVLRSGGVLDLEVPDVPALVEAYGLGDLSLEELLRNLYGDDAAMPDAELNLHRWGYGEASLLVAVEAAGFVDVERIYPEPGEWSAQLRIRAVRP